MKLDGRQLDNWFEQSVADPASDLAPKAEEYRTRFLHATTELNKHVHTEVTKGAIAEDGGFLTDHGPEHIKTVIARASQLVHGEHCQLTIYEVYILLMAIHFHDVGNAFGRKKHEQQAQKVMDHMGSLMGSDAIEKRMILQIARAHGGEIDGSKDTIEQLPERTHVLSRIVRPRMLAALLRFADELADDRDRAARFIMTTDTLPPESAIYHSYAHALHSVEVDTKGAKVGLAFDLEKPDVLRIYDHQGSPTYLLDYILQRSMKMHTERHYCMRFLRRHGVEIETVDAKIEVYDGELTAVETIAYRLAERGYPSGSQDIYDMCPELCERNGWDGRVCGDALAKKIAKA